MKVDSSRYLKILHVSDLHLGVSPRGLKGRNIDQVRRGDFRSAFKTVIDNALEEKVDAIIISGDVFHKTNPNVDDFVFFGEQIGRVTIEGTKVVVIAGNHDKPKVAGREHPLSTLVKVHAPNFYFFQKIPTKPLVLNFREKERRIAIIPIPYTDPNAVEYLEKHRSYERFIEDKISSLLEEPDIENSDHKILIAHLIVSGSKIKDIATVYYDDRERVALEALKYSEFDYVALGHIHENQSIRNNVWYAGSIEKIDFTEWDEEKYFNLIELGPSGLLVERRQIPTRPMRVLSYKELKDSVSPEKELDLFLEKSDLPRNSLIKLTVKGDNRAIEVLKETIFRLESLLEEKYGVKGYKIELKGEGIVEDILSITEEIRANIKDLVMEYIDKLVVEENLKKRTKEWAEKIISEVTGP